MSQSHNLNDILGKYDVPVSFTSLLQIDCESEERLTTPQKKPFYVNSKHFICFFSLFHIIDIINSEISKIREKYNEMHHKEIKGIDHMIHIVPMYGNKIHNMIVENVGSFRWNVQVTFNPTKKEIMFANNHNIILPKKDLIIRFTIVIYEEKDNSYVVEINRTSGSTRTFFYNFWRSLKESFEYVHALWENRKGIILLFDAISRYEKHPSDQITHYLFDIFVLMELCSFIGASSDTTLDEV